MDYTKRMSAKWQWLMVKGYAHWLDTGEAKSLSLPPEITYPDLKLNYAWGFFKQDLNYYFYGSCIKPHDQTIEITPCLLVPSDDYILETTPYADRCKIVLRNIIRKRMMELNDDLCDEEKVGFKTFYYKDLWDEFFEDTYYMPEDLGEFFEEDSGMYDFLDRYREQNGIREITYDSVSITFYYRNE